ncbi:MAG: methylmalonyl Co-A mutase-associated GTPase MeaB [Chitinophagales bacterium]
MKDLGQLSADQFIEGIRAGDTVIIARAITLLESSIESHKIKAADVLKKCLPYAGNSIRIGISGAPGVGKSTFIEAIGNFILEKNKKLAVLAVDPSSKKSKGSVLGDKTRMQELAKKKNVFIRPTASGEKMGGVASATRETIILLEAAGYEIILVETVGVGQNETAVYDITDIFILLLIAGAGDELQGIKRGIMEMADIIAINKSDGENIANAKIAKADAERAIHFFHPKDSGWQTTVDTISSLTGDGVEKIWQRIIEHHSAAEKNGWLQQNRKQQFKLWFYDNLNNALLTHFTKDKNYKKLLSDYENKIAEGKILPTAAVEELLKLMFRH